VNSRLKQIRTWETLAQESRYSASSLARRCGVSVRQLERFSLEEFGQPPHEWLHSLRLRRAAESFGAAAKLSPGYRGYEVIEAELRGCRRAGSHGHRQIIVGTRWVI
jgi:hypothetical protein